MCLYTVEQCSAINRLSIDSTSTNFLSLVFVTQNFVLFTFGRTQKDLWPCLGAFCYQHAFRVHMFCYDLYSIIANFATGFSWISRINTEPNIKHWILQPHLSVKNFRNVVLVHQDFFIRHYYQGCGSGSAKILPLPLPQKLFDLESNLAKKFCPFPNVDLSGELNYNSGS